MSRQVFYIALLCVLLAGCRNRDKKAASAGQIDSTTAAAQSAINKMVDEMAPPDSTYSGDFFLKYDNGLMKVKGYFRFGKRHGQWFYYYPHGYLWSDGFFDNGKMTGPTKVYHENGRLYYEGGYKQDLAVGKWNFYDTSGTLLHVRTYDSLGRVLDDKDIVPGTKGEEKK